MIEERKASYREHGIAYYRPWAFLITDGEPNDHWKPVVSRVQDGEKQKVVLLLRRGRRRRQHGGARGDLRPQAAVAAGHEVPRAVQLAVEFAAGGVAILAGRRSAARGSDDRARRAGPPYRWQAVWRHIAQSLQGPSHSADEHSVPGLLIGVRVLGEGAPCDARRLRRRRRRQREVQRRSAPRSPARRSSKTPRRISMRTAGFDGLRAATTCSAGATTSAPGSETRPARGLRASRVRHDAVRRDRRRPRCRISSRSAMARSSSATTALYGVVFWPQSGEYANSTNFLTSDEYREQLEFIAATSSCSKVALMTDGLERLALRFDSQTPHAPFFEPLVPRTAGDRRRRQLERRPARVSGDPIRSRTDLMTTRPSSSHLAHRRRRCLTPSASPSRLGKRDRPRRRRQRLRSRRRAVAGREGLSQEAAAGRSGRQAASDGRLLVERAGNDLGLAALAAVRSDYVASRAAS